MDVNDYEQLRNLTLLFFLEKLLDKGDSRSLHDLSCQFGTKGFSKEMRQIAGGSKAGLKRFLSQYPSLFCIEDESVSIAQIVPSSSSSSSPSAQGETDYGHKAMLYFKDKLKQYGEGIEVPIKSLLGHRSQAPPEVRHVSGQHIKEFRDFLAKYSDDFVVTEDTIYLKEYGNMITTLYSEEKQREDEETIEKEDEISPSEKAELIEAIKSFLPCTMSELLDNLLQEFEARGEVFPLRTEQNLKTFLKIYPNSFLVQGNTVTSLHKSPTRSVSSSSTLNSNNPAFSLKDRINSVVKKAMADNSQRDSPVVLSNGGGGSPNASPSRASPPSSTSSEPMPRSDNVRVITDERECVGILQRALNSKSRTVAVELKGINLGPEGKITSVHLSHNLDGPGGRVIPANFILDFIALPQSIFANDLKTLLESENVTKVMHDCRSESATLWFQHSITLSNVFDTQAAFAALQHQDNIAAVHKVKNVSMLSLCRHYNVRSADELQALRNSKRDQRFWTRRPLEPDAVMLGSLEVATLAQALHPKLEKLLKPETLPLFEELCEEQLKLYVDPDTIKARKNQRKIDLEIADIKEKLNASNGKNVVLSNREIRLLRFMELTDDDIKKIKGSAKVAKKLERLCNPPDATCDADATNGDSNPPSLESISSGSGHSPNPSSPSSMPYDRESGLERIEKLEAIINNITQLDSSSPVAQSSPTHGMMMAKSTSTVATQTLSTGDIVMTKVYAENNGM